MAVLRQFIRWREQDAQLIAPALWLAESISAIWEVA
jgi:hypothetical protein